MQISDLQQIFSGILKKTGKTEIVELTPGQVINVAVRSVNGNLATINYRGMDLVAQLEVEVPEGEQLKFLVAGERDGQIILKLLTNLANVANDTAGELLNIARELGLSDHSSNQALIREMMKQGLPLNPDDAEKLSAFIKSGHVTEKDIWLPVFMLSKGISLTSENYQKMTALLTDMDYLHADLKQLTAEISRLAAADPKSELGQLALEIGDILATLDLEIAKGQEVVSAKLESVFRMLAGSTFREQVQTTVRTGAIVQTGSAVQEGTTVQEGSTVQVAAEVQQRGQAEQAGAAAAQPGAVPAHKESLGLQPGMQALNDELKQALAGKPGVIVEDADLVGSNGPMAKGDLLPVAHRASQIQSNVNINNVDIDNLNINNANMKTRTTESHHSLFGPGAADEVQDKGINKTDLVDLLHRLSVKLAGELDSGHRELAKLAGRVADRLDFLQNFNNHAEPGRENLIIVHSSVNYEQNSEPLRMVIRYRQDTKGNKRDFSSCSIEVKLNTPGLGPVKCDIQVINKDLAVQFVTETDAAGRLLDSFGGTLASRLEDMNYHVIIQPYKLRQQDLKEILPGRNSEIPGLFQINLQI